MRKQLSQFTGRLRRKAFEDVFEVAMRIMSVELRGLDQAHDVGGTLTGTKRSGKEPVRSIMHGPPGVVSGEDIIS